MKKRIAVAYLIGIHFFLVVVLLRSDFIIRVQRKFTPQQTVLPPEITKYFYRILRYHKRMDNNVPNGAIVFIGDSITQGLCVSAVASPSVNYGIGSDTTAGVLQRLPFYKSIKRARAIVIAIGINDIKRRSNDKILENYRFIIDQLPKTTPVIFSAVLPLDEEVREEWKGYNQGYIKDLNSRLKHLVSEAENLFFIDAGPLLVDENGNLSDIYYDADGLHLNSKGNTIWINVLRKGLQAAQQEH